LVICPKCKNKLQTFKALSLSINNTVTCQVCSSRLRIKEKGITGGIGFILGWLPFGIGVVLGIEYDVIYFLFAVILTILDFFLLVFLIDKSTKVTLAE